jgi:hypothetical protein
MHHQQSQSKKYHFIFVPPLQKAFNVFVINLKLPIHTFLHKLIITWCHLNDVQVVANNCFYLNKLKIMWHIWNTMELFITFKNNIVQIIFQSHSFITKMPFFFANKWEHKVQFFVSRAQLQTQHIMNLLGSKFHMKNQNTKIIFFYVCKKFQQLNVIPTLVIINYDIWYNTIHYVSLKFQSYSDCCIQQPMFMGLVKHTCRNNGKEVVNNNLNNTLW